MTSVAEKCGRKSFCDGSILHHSRRYQLKLSIASFGINSVVILNPQQRLVHPAQEKEHENPCTRFTVHIYILISLSISEIIRHPPAQAAKQEPGKHMQPIIFDKVTAIQISGDRIQA